MGKRKARSVEEILSTRSKELRGNKYAFRELVNEVTCVEKIMSTISLSIEDLIVLKEWAREYGIFIREHKSGHGDTGGCNYRAPHIHIDITGRALHNKVHYLVDVTT
ncbi:hypothetical protein HOG16_03005 [Candidatus Woesearchaeota archaeon]|jgi:hypothetical protein|nr:hypothetical protein [Candidatus Woesearchaeota archaeon]MBT4322287.1 hypothetical protein [Candidatus Woesearchaeota archaeon]MBT4630870.1 hypothetical protein [Candidatus Woesearchaeota archaeon]